MTQDRNQQNRGAGQQQQQGGQQQQQQGAGGKQQGAGSQQRTGQQQAFSNQGQMPSGSDVNQQGAGMGSQRQSGGISGSQQGGMSGQSQQFAQQIRPHMEVVDNRGQHVGTVDSCEGNRIKLTKSDSSSGQHRFLQLNQVESVDGGQVRLSGGAQFLS